VVAQIITSHKSNLPVWLEVLSGNSSDKESFAETVKVYVQPTFRTPVTTDLGIIIKAGMNFSNFPLELR
jgi:hypothetical protein